MREAKAVCGIDSFYGAPGWNRTNDPQLRRLMLYPTELRAHVVFQSLTRRVLNSTLA